MSVKKWHQLAEEKSAVDQQTQEIHQKFKVDKINKEFSQLSGEELFKPITKRLDEKSSATVEEEEEGGGGGGGGGGGTNTTTTTPVSRI